MTRGNRGDSYSTRGVSPRPADRRRTTGTESESRMTMVRSSASRGGNADGKGSRVQDGRGRAEGRRHSQLRGQDLLLLLRALQGKIRGAADRSGWLICPS